MKTLIFISISLLVSIQLLLYAGVISADGMLKAWNQFRLDIFGIFALLVIAAFLTIFIWACVAALRQKRKLS